MGEIETQSLQSQPEQGTEFDPHAFLEERGIESFSEREVSYEGKSLPLHEALVVCGHARKAIDAAVGMAKTMGDENVLPMMDKYLSTMAEQPAANSGAIEEAKKKDS
jgi:hypothetical protein